MLFPEVKIESTTYRASCSLHTLSVEPALCGAEVGQEAKILWFGSGYGVGGARSL